MSKTFWTLLTAESQHDAAHTERAQALLLQTSWTLHSCSSSLQLTLCLSLIPSLRTRRRKPPLPTPDRPPSAAHGIFSLQTLVNLTRHLQTSTGFASAGPSGTAWGGFGRSVQSLSRQQLLTQPGHSPRWGSPADRGVSPAGPRRVKDALHP